MEVKFVKNDSAEDRAIDQIIVSINNKDLDDALCRCEDFLDDCYGKRATRLWALRDFFHNQVPEDPKIRSRFDQCVAQVFRLREEKSHGWRKPKYESPYFIGTELEKLDDLYEKYADAKGGAKRCTPKTFLRWIDGKITEYIAELPL